MRMNRAPAPFTTTACWRPPDSQRGLRSRTPRPWRPRPTRATRSTPTPNRSQLGVRTAATSPPLRTGSVEVAATSRSPQMRAVCCTRGSSGVSALSTMNTNRSRPVPGLQHRRQLIRPPAPARLGIERADTPFQPIPWDQAINALQEYLPAGLALLAGVFQVRKCRLVHRVFTPNISVFRVAWYYATTHQTCSEYP